MLYWRPDIRWRPEYAYENEDGILLVLQRFLMELKEEGFALLDKESIPQIPKSQRTTVEEEKILSQDHEALYLKFLKRINISDPETLDNAIDIIKKVVKENRHIPYPQSRDLMLGIAAFYGTQLVRYTDAKWEVVKGGDIFLCKVAGLPILYYVHCCWYDENCEPVIALIEDTLRSKS